MFFTGLTACCAEKDEGRKERKEGKKHEGSVQEVEKGEC